METVPHPGIKKGHPPRSTGLFVSLESKVGCEPHTRHQNKGVFNHNNNLEWLLWAFEATRFGGALGQLPRTIGFAFCLISSWAAMFVKPLEILRTAQFHNENSELVHILESPSSREMKLYFPTVVCNTLGVLNALRRDRESLIDLDNCDSPSPMVFPMESDLLAMP